MTPQEGNTPPATTAPMDPICMYNASGAAISLARFSEKRRLNGFFYFSFNINIFLDLHDGLITAVFALSQHRHTDTRLPILSINEAPVSSTQGQKCVVIAALQNISFSNKRNPICTLDGTQSMRNDNSGVLLGCHHLIKGILD